MDYFFDVAVFVFGTIWGSFLNVIIFRLNTGKTIIKGNSQCFSCGKKLGWAELVPIFSFLVQRGKCRGCGSKISIQYLLVEFLTGFLFILIFNIQYSISNLIFYWVIVSLLIVIVAYDLRHMIIPNVLVWIFNFLVAGYWLVAGFDFGYFLSGIALAGFFALLWLVSRGKWMGFGDAKLALGIGWLAGPWGALSVFLYSFWLGAVVGIFLLFFRGLNFTIKSKIPFAPFLVVGFLIYFLSGFSINNLLKLFYF